MVVEHHIQGYEAFLTLIKELECSGEPINLLFSGSKTDEGHSWCPQCVNAEPVVQKALEKAPEKSHYVHVDVGERAYWKDLNCPFRKDPNTHLVCIPTLMRWKGAARLDGDDVAKPDLVEMLFEEEC